MKNLFAFFDLLLYFVALFIPVVVTGPIASLLFVSYAKKKKLTIAHLVSLFLSNVLSILFITASQYSRVPDLLFCLTPIAIAVSLLILRLSWKTLLQIGDADVEFQKRMDLGIFLIIFLQVIVFVIMATIAPD